MASFEVINGDVLETLRKMEPCSFEGCLTDPPYALGESRSPQRKSGKEQNKAGFMGMKWDSDIPGPEVWAEVLRVLKPGSPLLAFGGTRTYHRLACAIEDAGFEIRDCLMWLYGQGFPKAKSCLKPAYEPIILARKCGPMLPLAIDASRIETNENLGGGQSTTGRRAAADGWLRPWMKDGQAVAASISRSRQAVEKAEALGRWPANVLLDPESAAALDAQSGNLISGKWDGNRNTNKTRAIFGEFAGSGTERGAAGDSGGASRFFYVAKADPGERHADGNNPHPCVKPVDLCAYLAKLIRPDGGGRLLTPYSGSGSEMMGAIRAGWNEVIGIEKDPSYVDIARRRIYGDAPLFTEQAKGVEIERST